MRYGNENMMVCDMDYDSDLVAKLNDTDCASFACFLSTFGCEWEGFDCMHGVTGVASLWSDLCNRIVLYMMFLSHT